MFSNRIIGIFFLALTSTPAFAVTGDLMLLGVGRGSGSPPGIAYVQGTSAQNHSTSSTTITATLASAVRSGDALFISMGWVENHNPTTMSCTDDKSNTYTVVDNALNSTASYFWSTAWLPNITNSPTVITCTITTASTFASVIVDEFSGLGATATLDKHAINPQSSPGTGTDNVTSGSVTTTAADFVYSTVVSISSDAMNYGTGYTGEQALASTAYSEYLIQGSSGSVAGTYTATLNGDNTITALLAITY